MTLPARRPDWAQRLGSLIVERRLAPFVWGQHDCALWATDGVLALTGEDLGTKYRCKYSDARGAVRALLRNDGVLLPVELADKRLGERRHPAEARMGDVVAAVLDDGAMGPTLGLCYGRLSLFVGVESGRDGLVGIETLSLEHCYHV